MQTPVAAPDQMIVFGPVPSRRLGKSVGINNIPPKICTYSCVYCQLGRIGKLEVTPRPFYEPHYIQNLVAEKIKLSERAGETIDYLTFVADGEPTLDSNLGQTIELLQLTGKKVAVISNASLLQHKQVKDDLLKADWVSLKVDAVEERIWRKINCPHRSLQLSQILDAIIGFAAEYRGKLVTETMLVCSLNDNSQHITALADFISPLPVHTAFLSIPIRPPAAKWVQAPTEEALIQAYQILKSANITVEYLIGYEGNAFAFTGNVEKDLLAITAVHPMREDAVQEFLVKARADWSVVARLLNSGQLVKTEYNGSIFYTRKLFQG